MQEVDIFVGRFMGPMLDGISTLFRGPWSSLEDHGGTPMFVLVKEAPCQVAHLVEGSKVPMALARVNEAFPTQLMQKHKVTSN